MLGGQLCSDCHPQHLISHTQTMKLLKGCLVWHSLFNGLPKHQRHTCHTAWGLMRIHDTAPTCDAHAVIQLLLVMQVKLYAKWLKCASDMLR